MYGQNLGDALTDAQAAYSSATAISSSLHTSLDNLLATLNAAIAQDAANQARLTQVNSLLATINGHQTMIVSFVTAATTAITAHNLTEAKTDLQSAITELSTLDAVLSQMHDLIFGVGFNFN